MKRSAKIWRQAVRRAWDSGEAGFSLLELLAVIVIITALTGILLPVVGAVRRKAKEGKARVQINQLATALQSFNAEYTRSPSQPANGALLAAILAGGLGVDGTITNNPRRIVFMEFKPAETNAVGVLDPWKQA